MRAFKFLLAGAVGPFSGFAWTPGVDGRPGPWVEAAGELGCANGIHACGLADLPFWLQDELWLVELRGPLERGRHKLVARGGRLLARVEPWRPDAWTEFAAACVERVHALADRRPDTAGYLDDLAAWAPGVRPAAVASLAARAAEAAGGTGAYDAERETQARWLAERLRLEPLLAV